MKKETNGKKNKKCEEFFLKFRKKDEMMVVEARGDDHNLLMKEE